MTPVEFADIVGKHQRYLDGQHGGVRANLTEVNLAGLRLARIRLKSAILAGANF